MALARRQAAFPYYGSHRVLARRVTQFRVVMRRTGWWLIDRIWPTLEPVSQSKAEPASLTIEKQVDADVIRLAHAELSEATAAENDRSKSTDAKLMGITSM